jgi:uncharacterized protein
MKKKLIVVLVLPFLIAFTRKQDNDFYLKLVEKAIEQTRQTVKYDPAYVQIKYPGGDVSSTTGVCTDLVIRVYRGVGIDLQKEVHEDMEKRFGEYPKIWGLKKTDTNIDHRRVPNLMKFLEHRGAKLKISDKPIDYKPGDLVTWNLQNKNSINGITHIGIVTSKRNGSGERYLIAHNIGGGNVLEDMLFSYTIIGHYRFKGN